MFFKKMSGIRQRGKEEDDEKEETSIRFFENFSNPNRTWIMNNLNALNSFICRGVGWDWGLLCYTVMD